MAGRLLIALAAVAVVIIGSTASSLAEVDRAAVAAELERLAAARVSVRPAEPDLRPRVGKAVLDFYERNSWQPVWLARDGKTLDQLRGAMEILAAAADEGLRPADYALPLTPDELTGFADSADAAALAEFDIDATIRILTYARDLAVGRRAPNTADPNVFLPLRPLDLEQVLERMADRQANIRNVLALLAPGHDAYRRLRAALPGWRSRARAAPPPPVPEGPAPEPGDAGPLVSALIGRLQYWGALEEPADSMTPDVVAALKAYQAAQGLAVDGVAGKATRAALNMTAADRERQIELAMERWRWMPEDLGGRHVLVNIAGFETLAVRNGRAEMSIRSVVGRDYRMTPVFSDMIAYVEINPTWTVPPKIAVKDLLPKIRKDPEFLSKGGYEVWSGWQPDAKRIPLESVDWSKAGRGAFPYRLRQGAGLNNALGEVKIMFPNRFDVYLHDSPARELYEKPVRAFSSGCIRLEKPFDMVRWLMAEGGGADDATIEEHRKSRKTVVVRLEERIPVHLMYATAWPDAQGGIRFHNDVYGRDDLLSRALGLE